MSLTPRDFLAMLRATEARHPALAAIADGHGLAASARFANARLEAQIRAMMRRIAQLESDDRRTQAVLLELTEVVEALSGTPIRTPMNLNTP